MAIDVSAVVSQFGAYYKPGSDNQKNLRNMLYKAKETAMFFADRPTEDTIWRGTLATLNRVVQPFQKAFTPIGTTTFKPNQFDLYKIKIDFEETPDDLAGGTVDGTANLATEIQNSTKPVVAFVNGLMCSAAYWIGSSADLVIADNANNGYNAMIGSIGTMAMWQDNTKQKEAAGVKTHMVYATKSVKKGAYMNDANSGNYTRLIQDLDNLNETFLNAVQQNRGDKLKLDKENVLQGDVYDAKAALKYGLIDKIGNLQDAVRTGMKMYKQQQEILNNNSMKWNKVLAFFGLASIVSAADVKLEDAQLDNMEALINERDALKTANDQLKMDLQKEKDAVIAANATISAKDATIAEKDAEIEKLGKEDGAVITTVEAAKDKNASTEVNALEMDFQKELFNKV